MTSCAFCGRENDAASRYCIDCGKPLNPSAVRVGQAHAPHAQSHSLSGSPADPDPLPPGPAQPERGSMGIAFGDPLPGGVAVPAAGFAAAPPPQPSQPSQPVVPQTRVSGTLCPRCHNALTAGLPFCGYCGQRVGERVAVDASPSSSSTQIIGAGHLGAGPRLSLLGDAGEALRQYTLERNEAVVGRGDADIRFEQDVFMSPIHARLEARDEQLWLRDLGSRNGSWAFIDEPTRLTDGDLVLVGSQLLRYRRLGFPGPSQADADSTRRMGSMVPSLDTAVLEQLRADGSCRDVYHLSPGRTIVLGRETGDWVFTYDATMSGRHAEIRAEDNEFSIQDLNSRNGIAIAVRGEHALRRGQRLLIGDQVLRVESV